MADFIQNLNVKVAIIFRSFLSKEILIKLWTGVVWIIVFNSSNAFISIVIGGIPVK